MTETILADSSITETTMVEDIVCNSQISEMPVTGGTPQMTVITSLICILCSTSKVFCNDSSLLNHMRMKHNVQITVHPKDTAHKAVQSHNSVKDAVKSRTSSACTHCSRAFCHSSSLYRHMRITHNVQRTVDPHNSRRLCCSVQTCKEIFFGSIDRYREHLHNVHLPEITARKLMLNFNTFADFEKWLSKEQRKDVSKFVQYRAVKKDTEKKTWHYYCHRSGYFQSRSSGRRQLKIQGSCKSGVICPAAIIVVNVNNRYQVTYYPTHYGHENSLGHLTLSRSHREYIAGELAHGMSADQILDNIRLSMNGNLDRLHLISRKDIHNIRKAFNFPLTNKNDTEPKVVDSVSTDSSLQELKGHVDDNPVPMDKEQD